jgi:hypothetical protein
VKSGTSEISTFQMIAKFFTLSDTLCRVSSMIMQSGSCITQQGQHERPALYYVPEQMKAVEMNAPNHARNE